MKNFSHPNLTHILRAERLEFLIHCCSIIYHKLVWSMRNSDPGVRNVFAFRHNTDLNFILTMQIADWQLPNTGPILVFPLIQPFGCDASSSLGRVYSRQATALIVWEFRSVFRHEILSNFNNIHKILRPYKICSICFVVAIENPCEQGHHNPKKLLS